jgi:dienelactone hydrolase
VGHGFQRKKGNMVDWGQELARRGHVAAVPAFPGLLPDYPLNAKIVSGLLDWMATAAPLSGKADSTRRGVLGYSAGGLAVLMAASTDQTIDIVVGVDPIDQDGRGVKAAPLIKAPVAFVRGEPGTCNYGGNAANIFAALVAPRLSLRVKKATHCDGESPSDGLCALFCGGAHDKARHLLFRRYAFAALDYHLLCDAAMAPWLGGASAKADTAITDIVVKAGFPPQPSCGATPDAGPPVDSGPADAAASDGPITPDGRAPTPDAGSPQPDALPAGDAPPPGDDGGCSCAVTYHGRRDTAPLLLLLSLFLFFVLFSRPRS